MDAIKRKISGGSEPIDLISDALDRRQPAHTDGEQVKYQTRGCLRSSLTPPGSFAKCCRRSRVRTRTRKSVAPAQFCAWKKKKNTTSASVSLGDHPKNTDYRSVNRSQSENRSTQTTTLAPDSSVGAAEGRACVRACVRRGTRPASTRPGS